MDEVAGLNDSSSVDVLRGIAYGLTAFMLIVVSYILFIKKYKRNKMEAVNALEFITSRYNIYTENSQFLIIMPKTANVIVNLLDESDNVKDELINQTIESGKFVYDFKTTSYPNGMYFLSLKSDGVNILRKIKINHT